MAIIEFVGGYLADKVIDQFCTQFKTSVIERWSRQRAAEFVKTFCVEVGRGIQSEGLADALEQVVKDEAKSAALFDAYRRVALSTSPTIGPRIIALITARLVSDLRPPSRNEERLLAAAEMLSDTEFAEAKDWFDRYVCKLPQPLGSSYYDAGLEEDGASVDLWDGWGAWAAKLGQLGIITQSIRIIAHQQAYGEFIESSVPKLATDMWYDITYQELRQLIEVASRCNNGFSH